MKKITKEDLIPIEERRAPYLPGCRYAKFGGPILRVENSKHTCSTGKVSKKAQAFVYNKEMWPEDYTKDGAIFEAFKIRGLNDGAFVLSPTNTMTPSTLQMSLQGKQTFLLFKQFFEKIPHGTVFKGQYDENEGWIVFEKI
ncbi:hypothetical protein M0R19_05030 [Candidatus Pacearchaeota archaeon]|nr:hypothetical protein [Candidatus Pacearchaeota archaeon]